MTLRIDRPSIVQSVEEIDCDLQLTIRLYDLIAPPPMAEPVLELTLHDFSLEGEGMLSALLGATIWAVEQERIGTSLTLTFEDDWNEIARINCQRVSSKRRAFNDSDWQALISSYDRLVERDYSEIRRLNRIVREIELAIEQRIQRSRLILDASGDQPIRAAKATGQLKALMELSTILRSSLDHEP